MPLMMTDVAAGANAGVETQTAPYRAQAQIAQLQDLVDPTLRAAKNQAQIADSQIKQYTATKMMESISQDADARQLMQSYYADPSNQGKDGSTAMSELSQKIMGTNPKLGMKMAEDAGKIQRQQAQADEYQQQANDRKMDTAFKIAEGIDPTDSASIQRGILAANLNGLQTDQFYADLNQYGPDTAKQNLLNRLTTLKREDEQRKQAASLAKAQYDNDRINAANERNDIAWARIEAADRARNDKLTVQDSKVKDNFDKARRTEYNNIRSKYESKWQTATQKLQTSPNDETLLNNQHATTQEYYDDIDAMNKYWADKYTDKGFDYTPFEIGVDKSKQPPVNTPSKPTNQKFVEGQVYTDAKGNKAKYQNGTWVEIK